MPIPRLDRAGIPANVAEFVRIPSADLEGLQIPANVAEFSRILLRLMEDTAMEFSRIPLRLLARMRRKKKIDEKY
jgi:hypothetical protein